MIGTKRIESLLSKLRSVLSIRIRRHRLGSQDSDLKIVVTGKRSWQHSIAKESVPKPVDGTTVENQDVDDVIYIV